jgi:hypothetical protein
MKTKRKKDISKKKTKRKKDISKKKTKRKRLKKVNAKIMFLWYNKGIRNNKTNMKPVCKKGNHFFEQSVIAGILIPCCKNCRGDFLKKMPPDFGYKKKKSSPTIDARLTLF